MRLDETRIRQTFFERAENGIETFHVTNLKDEPALSSQFRQFARMRGVFRDWFLDQKMFIPREQFTGRNAQRAIVVLDLIFVSGILYLLSSSWAVGLGSPRRA